MLKTVIFCFTCVISVYCVELEDHKLLAAWRDFPLSTMLNKTVLQPQCQKAYQNFLDLVQVNDLNALKMLDATAKLPSGILSGNINQYGDFDECMEVEMAQYCLVEVDLEPLWRKPFSKFKNLAHSFYFLRDNFENPAHRIPGFTISRWGFCIPRDCSSDDLEISLRESLGVLTHVRAGMCQKSVQGTRMWTFGDYAARLFFAVIFLAVVTSSLIDYVSAHFSQENRAISHIKAFKERKHAWIKILMSFSIRKNFEKLCEVKENNNEIAGLHSIRLFNAVALLMSHKGISLFFNPFMNRTATIARLSQPWTIIAKNAIIYTDSFMLISGLLNANALLNELINGQPMKFKDKLINRIFRILPNVVALILFCTYILPSMGSGPLWPTLIDHHSVLCKKYMWRNLFFIHNYFGFENMCLTHTHQLGIDMQLFLITPIIISLTWNFKAIGVFVLVILALASSILRFWVSYSNELTSVIYFGISVSKMFETANLSYILPTHRATIYLIGVSLAYYLKFSKIQPSSFSKIKLTFLWGFFLTCFFLTWMGPYHMVLPNYVYNNFEASFIAAVYPIFWGISVAFGIYAANKNIAGWFGKLMCWKYFQIFTKIAYALYLVQFPVFFYNVGSTRHVDEYKAHYQLQIFETMIILICSVLLVLLIEMPFQSIKRILFDEEISQQQEKLHSVQRSQTRKPKFG